MINKILQRQIEQFFKTQYQVTPELLSVAPGRINLIGEHTDYNNGFVFPAAIDRHMYFGFRKNKSQTVNLHALNLDEHIELNLNNLCRSSYSWANYLIGNLLQLLQHDHSIEGFECVFASDIPMGAGLSSSSAMECGFLQGINKLFHIGLDKWNLIDYSQNSNHTFLGVQGGFMDQFACLFGKQNHAMLLDCRDRSYEYYPINMNGYHWVLINSMVTHDHVTSAYNDRVAACQVVVQHMKKSNHAVSSLRDISLCDLNSLKATIDNKTYKCAMFVLKENQRTKEFGHALKLHNFDKIGQLLQASHCGLQKNYKVSCEELDLLVELANKHQAVLGARMMGGGFGGCTLNLIKTSEVETVASQIIASYHSKTGITASIFLVNLSEGAQIL